MPSFSFRSWFLCMFVLSLSLAATPAWSQTKTKRIPPELTIALTQETVSAGEPLTLRYHVRNPSAEYLFLDPIDTRLYWLRFELFDKTGQQSLRKDSLPPFAARYIYCEPYRLRPKESDQGQFVVGPGLWTPAPGHYVLRLTVHLTYQGYERLSQTVSLPFTVTPRDASKLKTLAQELRQKAVNEKGDARREDMIALFSLPEGDAAPQWREVTYQVLGLETSNWLDADYYLGTTLSPLDSPVAKELKSEISSARQKESWEQKMKRVPVFEFKTRGKQKTERS
jgi:hypothetical protein